MGAFFDRPLDPIAVATVRRLLQDYLQLLETTDEDIASHELQLALRKKSRECVINDIRDLQAALVKLGAKP